MDDWFGHPVGPVMHRLFFEQLGPSGVWLEDAAGEPVGFLLGLVSEAEPDLAYVHMHVVAPAWRGAGAGERLYREFCDRAVQRGCRRVRALAAPDRAASRRFHERLASSARRRPGTSAPGPTGSSTSGGFRSIGRVAGPEGGGRGGGMADPAPQDERRAHRARRPSCRPA